MRKVLAENSGEVSMTEYYSRFELFAKVVRDIIRHLSCSGDFDLATLLEMLWKLLVKTIDTGLLRHDAEITKIAKNASYKLRNLRSELENTITAREKVIETSSVAHAKEVKRLTEHIQNIQADKLALERNLNDRDTEIAELTGIDSRNESVNKMTGLLKKLQRFFNETESEKTR